MNKSINRYFKLYPWFHSLTADLLFYIAIDTLFLTLVKNFSAAEIVSITSFSQLACIALQFPVLFIMKKIGNSASIKTGALLMLLSALLISFGKSYYLVLLGRIFHDASIIFKSASVLALENNLDMIDKRTDFVRIRTTANTVYAIITMLISFVASLMFNLNNYLPMIGCITTCTIGFVLSLFMKDNSDYNKGSSKAADKRNLRTGVKIHYGKVVIIAIVLYAMFYSVVSNGQGEGKLFIQENVLLDFDVEATSLIIGAIICISRIIRVISNMVFERIYKKYQEKMGIILSILICTAIGCMLFGSFIANVVIKISVMGIGYTIILFVRDPFKLYMQDVVFESTAKEHHRTLLTLLEFGTKISTAGIGLAFSAILLSCKLIVVVSIMFAIAISVLLISIMLYRAIIREKVSKPCSD